MNGHSKDFSNATTVIDTGAHAHSFSTASTVVAESVTTSTSKAQSLQDPERKYRTLVLCFDGTGNQFSTDVRHSLYRVYYHPC
jgi:uncharacterized protein (DUF2235 family)